MRIRPLLLTAALLAGCGSDTGSLTLHDGTRDVYGRHGLVDAPGVDIRRAMAVHDPGVLRLRLDLRGHPRDVRFMFDGVIVHHCRWAPHVDVVVPGDGTPPRARVKLQQIGAFFDPKRPGLAGTARLIGTTLRAQVPVPGVGRVGTFAVQALRGAHGQLVAYDELTDPMTPPSGSFERVDERIGCPYPPQVNVIR